jgi:NAD(P)-dependent dehydrogenase (short-subunit alcohol dehydrogenase family)
MSLQKVWLITGAGRGMGADIAKAALAAGDAIVATGRNPDHLADVLGQSKNLLPVRLDVDSRAGVLEVAERQTER